MICHRIVPNTQPFINSEFILEYMNYININHVKIIYTFCPNCVPNSCDTLLAKLIAATRLGCVIAITPFFDGINSNSTKNCGVSIIKYYYFTIKSYLKNKQQIIIYVRVLFPLPISPIIITVSLFFTA
jgi:hypothetical protein